MTMPEATVNEDDFAGAGQNYIGLSGQIRTVQSEPVSHAMKKRPHSYFNNGIPPLDAAHDVASLFGSKFIRHLGPQLSSPQTRFD